MALEMSFKLIFLCLFGLICLTESMVRIDSESVRTKRQSNGCWPVHCVDRRGPPVCERWCISYIKTGCCQKARYECCQYREKPGYCPLDSNQCTWVYPYYYTRQFECFHDVSCPMGYKCCSDSCYAHKICKEQLTVPEHTFISNAWHKENRTTTVKYEATTVRAPEVRIVAATHIYPKPLISVSIKGSTTTSSPESNVTDEYSEQTDDYYYYDEEYYN